MAGNINLIIRGTILTQQAREAHIHNAKTSLAFRRFLLLGEMAEDVGLCTQDIRFVLSKYFTWLTPEGKANVAKLTAKDIGWQLSTAGANPGPLYEGWFAAFAAWLNCGRPFELAVVDPALYADLVAHRLLARPNLRLPEAVQGRVKQAWWRVFNIASKRQVALCLCAVAEEPLGKLVVPGDRATVKVLTDLMGDVFALLDPPLDRLAFCEQPRGKPHSVNNLGFQNRWYDLLHILQTLQSHQQRLFQ